MPFSEEVLYPFTAHEVRPAMICFWVVFATLRVGLLEGRKQEHRHISPATKTVAMSREYHALAIFSRAKATYPHMAVGWACPINIETSELRGSASAIVIIQVLFCRV